MPWIKLDDQWMDHPKVIRAGRDARDMWLASITWCAKHLTDGYFPEELLPTLAVSAGINVANCQDFARVLLDVGLWDATENGYCVHDYLDYNPTKEQAEATKKARSDAGKVGGVAKAAKFKQNPVKMPSKTLAKSWQKSAPSPSPFNNSSSKTEDESHPKNLSWSLAKAMAPVCKMDFEANKGRLLKESSLLKDAKPPPTAELVKQHYGSSGWWYREDWRGKNGEPPTPATIRETWGRWKTPEIDAGPPQIVNAVLPDGDTVETRL